MDLGLTGRVALVTGASSGLGLASASALAAEGAAVVIASRGGERLARAEKRLSEAGASVLAIPGDLRDPALPAVLVGATIERFGRIDVLVANNGGPPPARSLEVDDAGLLAAFDQNFLVTARLVRAALPAMRSAGWGRICCIASRTVLVPNPNLATSNAARSALFAWARTAAGDLAGSGVTLNLVCPGLHRTERMAELGATGDAGDPADFGRIVAFLCSEWAAFVSGSAVVVDGGAPMAI